MLRSLRDGDGFRLPDGGERASRSRAPGVSTTRSTRARHPCSIEIDGIVRAARRIDAFEHRLAALERGSLSEARRLAPPMKLVMTLLARDEADVIDAWLSFHLNAGADFVVATDNRSDGRDDGRARALRARGHVHLIREPGEDLRQDEWVTRMARLAATDFGADWVINSDADEFWWPRGASLRDMLAAVPPRYGTVGAFLRMFPPRPAGEGSSPSG